MIGTLRERMKRLGVVMTLLALLFAATGPLEAVACVIEGCGPDCIELADTGTGDAAASDASGQTSDGCNDTTCVCAIGHCGHVFSIPVMIDTSAAPQAVERSAPLGAQPFTSASVQGLERPPRA
jgi:hypothetical protein